MEQADVRFVLILVGKRRAAGGVRGRRLVRRWLYEPYDLVVLSALLCAGILSLTSGENLLRFRTWMLPHIQQFILLGLAGVATIAGLRVCTYLWIHRQRGEGHARGGLTELLLRHFGPMRLIALVRFCIAVEVLMLFYTTIKQRIPRLHSVVFDDALMQLEQILHLGHQPAWLLSSLDVPTWWLWILDRVYVWWIPAKVVVITYVMTHRDVARRDRFLLTYLSLWVVGLMLGLALPSHGPAFVDPSQFPPSAMPIAAFWQDFLWVHYAKHEVSGGSGMLLYGCGLMAMPSLHVAAVALYAIFGWTEGRWIRWGTIVFALLIFIGSVVSGWHYAVDGYVAVAMALVNWHLLGWLGRRFGWFDRHTEHGRLPQCDPGATAWST